jgi:regulatory protein
VENLPELLKKELAKQMRSLARRSKSVHQVRQRLGEKEHLYEDDIEWLISRLVDYNFLDDERYASEFSRAKLRSGYGPVRIAQELSQAGIGEKIADIALAEELKEIPELGVLQETLEKRLRAKGKPKNRKELKRLQDHLTLRGFTFQLISDELDPFFKTISYE